jgi:hypothetical protein
MDKDQTNGTHAWAIAAVVSLAYFLAVLLATGNC